MDPDTAELMQAIESKVQAHLETLPSEAVASRMMFENLASAYAGVGVQTGNSELIVRLCGAVAATLLEVVPEIEHRLLALEAEA